MSHSTDPRFFASPQWLLRAAEHARAGVGDGDLHEVKVHVAGLHAVLGSSPCTLQIGGLHGCIELGTDGKGAIPQVGSIG